MVRLVCTASGSCRCKTAKSVVIPAGLQHSPSLRHDSILEGIFTCPSTRRKYTCWYSRINAICVHSSDSQKPGTTSICTSYDDPDKIESGNLGVSSGEAVAHARSSAVPKRTECRHAGVVVPLRQEALRQEFGRLAPILGIVVERKGRRLQQRAPSISHKSTVAQ